MKLAVVVVQDLYPRSPDWTQYFGGSKYVYAYVILRLSHSHVDIFSLWSPTVTQIEKSWGHELVVAPPPPPTDATLLHNNNRPT